MHELESCKKQINLPFIGETAKIYLLFGKRCNEVPIRCRIFNRPEAEEHFYPAYLAGGVRKGAVPVDGCSA